MLILCRWIEVCELPALPSCLHVWSCWMAARWMGGEREDGGRRKRQAIMQCHQLPWQLQPLHLNVLIMNFCQEISRGLFPVLGPASAAPAASSITHRWLRQDKKISYANLDSALPPARAYTSAAWIGSPGAKTLFKPADATLTISFSLIHWSRH